MSSKVKRSLENGVQTFSVEWGRQTLSIRTGQLASQANAACTVQYGDTLVLATAVMGKQPREGIDYFPLLVDFEERFYAAGKIKGSRFIKREGRPSDEAILSGRLIDRSLRPFFDVQARIDVQVVVNTLSWDGENDPDALGIIAASVVLHISDIPWAGPVVGVLLSWQDDNWTINPTYEERTKAQLDLLVSVREDKAVMIEAEGTEAPEEIVAEGVDMAIKEAQVILELLQFMREKIGLEKKSLLPELSGQELEVRKQLESRVTEFAESKIRATYAQPDKASRAEALDAVAEELSEYLEADENLTAELRKYAKTYLDTVLEKITRQVYLKESKRIDGRGFREIRPLSAQVGLLPRTHGSGLFQRGETQSLTILTLGSPSDEQILDTMEETDTKKRYMHHYNFPAFSVGEVRPNRGPGRREIGHGALAEKALIRMMPSKEEFPYTIRVVSEIMSSNGSTSMAATCGSTLALFDAGVPIRKPVAGIAMGIITDNEKPTENYRIMTDIQGLEDHYGEMDFKVAGTDTGITAIQLDVKNTGLTRRMTRETLAQARQARLQILDVIKRALPEPRAELSPYAPRITSFKIDPEKIRLVIGPGGKVINEIIDETNVKIDIEDDGLVMITSKDPEAAVRATKWIKDIVREAKPGELFEQAKITRIFPFGAMAEFLPGKEGMIHISELAPWRVGQVEDVVQTGDVVPVKVIEIDREGRVNLSLKQTDFNYSSEVKAKAQEASPGNFDSRPSRRPGYSGGSMRGRRPPQRRYYNGAQRGGRARFGR